MRSERRVDRTDGMPPPVDALFEGPGEACAVCRSVDWAATPLGPVSGWSPSLRLAVRLCLECRTAAALWIGPEFTLIHNETYAVALAGKSPAAMGRPLREVWPEVWDEIAGDFERVLKGGESIRHDEVRYRLVRDGQEADAYFAYSLTPLRDVGGRIIGVFNVVEEKTALVRARRERERQYRALFERIDDALCIVEPIVDGDGKPFDFRFLETNPAFVRHTGYENAVGKTARDVTPRLESFWTEMVGRVADTGEAVRVEGRVEGLGRWFEVFAFPADDDARGRVGVLFRDASQRKRAEEELRSSERRQSFLVRLTDALRPLADPLDIQEAAARTLGEQLRATRVAYAEMVDDHYVVLRDYVSSAPHITGRYPASSFGSRLVQEFREGRTALSSDTQSDPALSPDEKQAYAGIQVAAYIGVPLVKGEQLVAVMGVQSCEARVWTAEEVRLAEETAERTWASVVRARAEGELRRTNLRLNDTLASIRDDFYALDRDWRFLVVSSGFCARLGRKPEDLVGRDLWELYPNYREGALHENFSATMERGEVRRFEFEGQSGRIYRITSAPSADGIVVVATNITELRGAETDLRRALSRHEEQVRLFESVTSTTPDFVYVFDLQGRFVYANRRLLEVWGMELSEALGRTPRELGYEQWHHDMHMREIAQVVRTRQPIKGEVPFKAPRTGIAGIYEYIFTPVIGASGNVELVAGTTRDVTDRKRAEEALRESEARLRRLWESGMIGVLFFDLAAGTIMDANDEFLDMVGYTHDDLEAGRLSWVRMTPEEYSALDARAVHELRTSGVDTPYSKEFIRKDGSRVAIHIGAATFDPEKNRGIAFVLDISKPKELERALREANQQLIEADHRKNHFLAVLSHELRNPLTPIRNSLYILDRAVPGGDQARRARDVIERQVDQLSHLVDDLLDVTRITRGKIQLQRRRLELNELVRRTIDDHRALFQTADVRLELEPAAQPVFVDADWNRTAQVLSNLLQNSAKFTPPGGRVTATVERDAEARQAVLRVSDTGCGMTPELLARLFEPFMQADETLDRSRGGLGLGLALVKGIVEQHGGSIQAASEGPDRGSEFVVRLPLDLSAPETVERTPAPVAGVRRRVLVIEDNVDAAESLRELLELQGQEVAVAYRGPEGLAKAREFRPDLVLCDIGLPGMDGYEVARAFRSDGALRGIRLIALSGYALPEDLQRAAEAGFELHLSKPPAPERLERVLRGGSVG